ncbi:UNVERIFIED_CONTAM: hypothetical protein PYX00_003240 [Menopon gallinae]|uniref:Threonylcarbamoyl-AMP synthase n=1 Tax=Menopon gallinae TaxID=328185 RepID=A0AAW2I1L2_9NEOP
MFSPLARLMIIMGVEKDMVRDISYALCESVGNLVKVKTRQSVSIAAKYLNLGEVIAVPTDTVYGIAASSKCPEAVSKVYEIKKRDVKKPLAICVSKVSDIKHLGEVEHLDNELLGSLLPGAVTVVLKRKPSLESYINPSTDLIGIRIPDNFFIKRLMTLCNAPIILTSANLSFEPSALAVDEFSHLWPQLKAVFDAGPLGYNLSQRIGSTVVDLSEAGYFTILRAGISFEETVLTLKKFNLKLKL